MRQWLRIATLISFAAVGSVRASDWPQFNLDPQHSGNNAQERAITPGNVGTLHLAYPAVALPAVADGAPAFLEGVATPGGVKDLLFLTTKSGILLAIDAATGATVWSKQPATGPNYTTSSPAIDPSRQYVYSYGLEGRVHKYQVGDGTEVTTGGWPELVTRKPAVEKASSALALVPTATGNYLVVANGGYPGDAGDYQGHVTAIDLATGAQNVFNANCSDQTCHFYQNGSGGCGSPQPDCSQVQTAIWARAGVVYDSTLDLIFMATGNGTFDASTGGNDWGDSVFALHPDGTGNGSGWPVDSYTPSNFASLDAADLDLGSTAPAILPVPAGGTVADVAVQAGKDAKLRLLDLADLSGQGGPGHVGGELQNINLPQGGVVLTAPAVWVNPADGATWVFVANGSGISGLKLGLNGSGVPQLATVAPNVWTKTPGGASPIVANGMLFYSGYDGQIHALDPVTGTQLWVEPSPNGLHWESPIVVNGRLYVTDDTGHLLVYEPDQFSLAVTPSGSGTGTVTSNPAGIDCGTQCTTSFASGTLVTLAATPDAGSVFVGWSGEVCAGITPCKIAMTQARAVTARFGVLAATRFFPVTPCRVVDTRTSIDPATVKRGDFTDDEVRAYTLSESTDCPGLPTDASAWSLNVQLRPLTQAAYLIAFPDGVTQPAVSTLVAWPDRWRVNNAIVPAGAGAAFDVYCQYARRVVIDVNGYFK
jgi:outer membrane protein assembly factor BamB